MYMKCDLVRQFWRKVEEGGQHNTAKWADIHNNKRMCGRVQSIYAAAAVCSVYVVADGVARIMLCSDKINNSSAREGDSGHLVNNIIWAAGRVLRDDTPAQQPV